MLYTQMIKRALALSYEWHKDKLDRHGLPQFVFILNLASSMIEEHSICAALLYDVFSEKLATKETLQDEGIAEEVIGALLCLLPKENESKEDYLHRIKKNHIARQVKKGELALECELSRFSHITKEDVILVQEYRAAIELLTQDEVDERYFITTVVFSKKPKKLYYYRSDMRDIREGDQVIVPTGADNLDTVGLVIEAKSYSYDTLPIPLSRMKYVVRKFEGDEMVNCLISGRLIDVSTCFFVSKENGAKSEIKTVCATCPHYHGK